MGESSASDQGMLCVWVMLIVLLCLTLFEIWNMSCLHRALDDSTPRLREKHNEASRRGDCEEKTCEGLVGNGTDPGMTKSNTSKTVVESKKNL